MLEIIATSVEDAIIAEAGGANRLELCSALSEDGLTPSLGLIKNVVAAVDIPVFVMLRPHNNGFYYEEDDIAVMIDDLQAIKLLGAAGVVLGALTKENIIDEFFLKKIVPHCEGLQITFHRAFDEVENQVQALEILKKYPQIGRVLTSGSEKTAFNGLQQLQLLNNHAEHIIILAGAGVSADNAPAILRAGIKEIHVGSAVRFGKSFLQPIDIEEVRKITAQSAKFSK
ncbi:copper homeostasis protein CutC [Kurthia sibirica]|uniref:PF03932 family protein CutC n=1 Tax=Kurthia sibirica TaxID=202750 RepID=A0A2U3ALB3_9BACL|nr:copper homeostasis protein CutC [Kurthia sibirica]PWI25328.1 copper homeostasis protein [Kurthia sibirica]GEK34426.1 copper homeostasis protein CutC [Kurthia sibirica]